MGTFDKIFCSNSRPVAEHLVFQAEESESDTGCLHRCLRPCADWLSKPLALMAKGNIARNLLVPEPEFGTPCRPWDILLHELNYLNNINKTNVVNNFTKLILIVKLCYKHVL